MTSPSHLRLHQLRALVAAVEQGSIRAAARSQNLSQAALTKSLRGLEEAAGLALLTRKSSGVVLTAAGQRLLVRARLVTRQIDLAAGELNAGQSALLASVHVALTPFVTLTALGEAHRWFRQRYPLVQLQVHEGLVSRVLPGLRDGSIDFAIVANSGDVPVGEFAQEHLRMEPQAIVARAGHPLAQADQLAALADCEWVLPGSGLLAASAAANAELVTLFQQAGLAPPQRVTRGTALAAIALVRHSDALSIFPQALLAQPESQGVQPLRIQNASLPELELIQLALPDAPLTQPAAWLARCLRDACLRGSILE